MRKVYQIVAANGMPKASWEQIICDFIEVSDFGVVKFYEDSDTNEFVNLLIAYRLGDGEALVYVGEE